MEQKKETTKKLATIERNVTEQVLIKIKTLTSAKMLRLPKDYSPENALKASWIILQDIKDKNDKPALEICSKESIALALLKMVTEGLNPLKKQGSFIVRAGLLSWEREYDGDVALAKRAGLKWIRARCIYQGDEYITSIDENGVKHLVKHEQPLDNLDSNKIKGAYAIYEVEGEGVNMVEMTIQKIRTAWNQGAMKGNSPAHKNFPDEMCERTVIRKACKPIIRRADDSPLFSDDENNPDYHQQAADDEIKENANKDELSFDDVEEIKDEKVETNEKQPDKKGKKVASHEPVQQEIVTENAKPDF